MKKRNILPALLILPLLLTGCPGSGGRASSMSGSYAEKAAEEADAAYDAEYYAGGSDAANSSAPGAGQTAPAYDESRKLIRNISMNIVTANDTELAAAMAYVKDAAGRSGGYIGNEVSEKGYNAGGELTARIPRAKADAFLAEIRSGGYEITSYSDNVEDVTLQYTDVESRLESSRAAKARYMALLEKAESVEDILSIQQRIDEIIADEESWQRQLNALSSQVDYVTVRVRFSCRVNAEEPTYGDRFAGAVGDILGDAGQSLIDGISWFVNAVIWLVFILPVVFIVVRALMFVFKFKPKKRDLRFWRRRPRKEQDGNAADPAAAPDSGTRDREADTSSAASGAGAQDTAGTRPAPDPAEKPDTDKPAGHRS